MRLTDADELVKAVEKERIFIRPHDDPYDVVREQGKRLKKCVMSAPTVEQPRWIPVTERLPRRKANDSIYEICNLWHKGGYATAGRFHWGKMTWTFMPWDGTRVISVPHSKGVITHWQPLPAPPTPEECSAVGKEE